MASGRKELVINPQERALSVDINRLQKFGNNDAAELFRYLLDTDGNDDLDAGSILVEHAAVESPLRAEIINGLLVRPQQGSLNLLVDPGVLYTLSPDAAADDSNYKYVHDAGVPNAGGLVVTANGAGTPRIDIVECQINTTPGASIVETDNRDIFNPVTGLFSASNVTKALANKLTYRVRAGTPGAGDPGNVSGWLPLATINVPAGVNLVDGMIFWDNRPLISDREFGIVPLASDRPRFIEGKINATAASQVTTGWFSAIANGRRLGGRIRETFSTNDSDALRCQNSVNQEPGFTLVANRPWYIYAMTPGNRPRWARYTNAAPRLPRSPRGLLVVSMTKPDNEGRPSVAIALPVDVGGSSGVGVCIAAGYVDSTTAQKGFWGGDSDGIRLISTARPTSNPPLNPLVAAMTFSYGGGSAVASVTLTAGIHFPANAKKILLGHFSVINVDTGASGSVEARIQLYVPSGGAQISDEPTTGWGIGNGIAVTGAPTSRDVVFNQWVTLPPLYPTNNPAFTQRIDIAFEAGGFLTNGSVGWVMVLGWKF